MGDLASPTKKKKKRKSRRKGKRKRKKTKRKRTKRKRRKIKRRREASPRKRLRKRKSLPLNRRGALHHRTTPLLHLPSPQRVRVIRRRGRLRRKMKSFKY